MQTYPLSRILRQALRANRAHGFVYLNNPKVGCSTVKANLWSAVDGCPVKSIRDVHAIEGSPFEREIATLDWAGGAFVFTFVRNPYARIVSAWRNKAVDRRDGTWESFARRHGHADPTAPIGFDAFVEFIATVPPEEQDPHWRPQHLNTLHPFVQPNLLADLETMDRQLPQILARLFPGRPAGIASRARHSTGARHGFAVQLGDDGTAKRLRQLYAGDFEAFGYRRDPRADPAPRRGPQLSEHDHPGLALLARYHQAEGPARPALLRDLATGPGGAGLADWILAERLKGAAGNPDRRTRLLERNAGRIDRGPAFLRRALARGDPEPAEAAARPGASH